MKYQDFYDTNGHSYQEYDRSHKERFDFLIEDLKLNELKDKKIMDAGCGLGFIYHRLNPDIQKNYFGYDGTKMDNSPFEYRQVDLDSFSSGKERFFDVAFCFETLEHLTNPYSCLLEIKKSLKEDGVLYLSIPHQNTTHNTIYPGLLYPIQNFVAFLNQMAFEIVDVKFHDKSFSQNVFTLNNKGWDQSQMLWRKDEEKFRNIPPHISINL